MKKSIFIFLIVLAAYAFLRAGLNFSGFCWAEKRWFSDDEKIKSVLAQHINRRSILIYTSSSGYVHANNYKQIKYKNAEEYLKKYPDCCALNPGGAYGVPKRDVWKKIEGFWGDVVVIDYHVRYLDEAGSEQTKKTKFENHVSNCGIAG